MFKRKSRRTIASNTKFDIFFDAVEHNGESVEDYLVVAPKAKTKNLVTGVAILPVYESRFGLLKIYRHAVEDFSWEIPRGFVDEGEEEEGSAIRELEEETGFSCEKKDLALLGYFAPDAGTLAARIQIYAATRCFPKEGVRTNELGHKALEFLSAEQMSQMAATSIQDPSTLIAFYRYQVEFRR